MPSVNEANSVECLTFILPPLLAQHVLPSSSDHAKQQAPQKMGSCADESPRTLNSCN